MSKSRDLSSGAFLPADEIIKFYAPYIKACHILIVSPDHRAAAGLRYDDEDMYVPIALFLEEGRLAEVAVQCAEAAQIPIVENANLTKNLVAYGLPGEPVPELTYQETAAVLSRLAPKKSRQRPAGRRRRKTALPGPLTVEFGGLLWSLLNPESEAGRKLERAFAATTKKLETLFGYPLEPIAMAKASELPDDEFRIMIKGMEAARLDGGMQWYIVFDTGVFTNEKRLKTVLESIAGNIGRDVNEVAMRRAPELLGRDEVQAILDMAEEKYPVVTGEVKSLLNLGSIRDIFRGLLSEHVSIRNLPVILETLADWGSYGPAPGEIVIEQIRLALKRQICQEYARGTNIKALTLEPKLDERLADRTMLREGEEGLWDRCIDAFSPAIKGMEENNLPPVVICSPGARTWVKELTRKKFPGLAVLSYIEIPPDFNVEPVGEIRLSDGKL